MDPKEHERLLRHYAALTDDELRVAFGHGRAGYRDQETWELVRKLHEQRFGTKPTRVEPVPSRSGTTDGERVAPADQSRSSQLRSPWDGTLPFEILGLVLLGWLLPRLVQTKLGPAFTVTGMLGQIAVDLALIGLIAYLLIRRGGSLAPVGLVRIVWRKELRLAGVMLVISLIVSLVVAILAVGLSLPLPLPYDPDAPVPSTATRALFPLGLLVAASYEEFFFRAYLITRLRDLGIAPVTAVVGTSLVFGLEHRPLAVALTAFLFGLAFGGAFVKSRRLVGLILAHWLSNLSKWIMQDWIVQRILSDS